MYDSPPRAKAAANEQARVFYVALTRAKKRVYVTAPASMPINGKHGGEATFLQSIHEWAREQDETADLCFEATETPMPPGNGKWRSTPPLPVPRTVTPVD